ncbi:flavin monoamine oxidase family protein [Alkaliphilus peptidifermentans]|uniref:Monoamine oxidase n=1 Tax=Alkaliphilus peptidifermentans DSM 18978 TaxID=1120976 RepID=A0A1G5BKM9_9FIRM|nr:FAD-dependent oxidoreductase [Alkaliphilus peptidifermentans]SCX90667.1 monoamine oxidase [Alkaliphilus peptidifermentans DSM 18978]
MSKMIQPNNPTTEERHQLVKLALEENNRLEDFFNIVQLLNPPPDITTIVPIGSCKNIKVAVLGGGLAGLSSAFQLRKAGFDITIFEAEEDRIGGRVYTYYFDKGQPLYGELGPMRIPVSHETTWHYINLFKLQTRPFISANENAFRYVQGIRVQNDPEGREVQKYIYPEFNMTPKEREQTWTEIFDEVFEGYLLAMPPEIRREILQIKSTYSPEIVQSDYFNIRQMMEKFGLSKGAIEMLSSVEPFLGGFLIHSFFEMLQELYPVSFSFAYEIIGGLVKLPLSILSSLLSKTPKEYSNCISSDKLGNVRWLPGHQVMGLSQMEKNGSVTVHHRHIKRNLYKEDQFDFIVCAVPFSNLRLFNLNPVFNSSKMQAIRMLNMPASQKTVMLCNYRFWEAGPPNKRIIGGGSATDLVINTIWYPSVGAVNPHIPGVITASYNWTQDSVRLGNFKEPLRFEVLKRQIEEVHGLPYGSLDSIVIDHKTLLWNNHPWSLGAFAFYSPQQKVLYSKEAIDPEYNNRVFFAGEHVSVSRAWMQGALQTGMLAANEIAKVCGRYVK